MNDDMLKNLVDEGKWEKIIDIYNNYNPTNESILSLLNSEELIEHKKYMEIRNFYLRQKNIEGVFYLSFMLKNICYPFNESIIYGHILLDIIMTYSFLESENKSKLENHKTNYLYLKNLILKYPKIFNMIKSKKDFSVALSDILKDSKYYDDLEAYKQLSKIGSYMNLNFDSKKCFKQYQLFESIGYNIEMCKEILLLLNDEIKDYKLYFEPELGEDKKWMYPKEPCEKESFNIRRSLKEKVIKYMFEKLNYKNDDNFIDILEK